MHNQETIVLWNFICKLGLCQAHLYQICCFKAYHGQQLCLDIVGASHRDPSLQVVEEVEHESGDSK